MKILWRVTAGCFEDLNNLNRRSSLQLIWMSSRVIAAPLCACEVLFYPRGANFDSLNVRFWQRAQRLLTAGPGAICWRLVNGI